MATIICDTCKNELRIISEKSEVIPYSDELGEKLQTSETYFVEPCTDCLYSAKEDGYAEGKSGMGRPED